MGNGQTRAIRAEAQRLGEGSRVGEIELHLVALVLGRGDRRAQHRVGVRRPAAPGARWACRDPRTLSSRASTSRMPLERIRRTGDRGQAPRLDPAVDRKRGDANLIAAANACRLPPFSRSAARAIVQPCEVLLGGAQQGFHRVGLARPVWPAAGGTLPSRHARARTPARATRPGSDGPRHSDSHESRDHLDERGLVLQVRGVAAVLHAAASRSGPRRRARWLRSCVRVPYSSCSPCSASTGTRTRGSRDVGVERLEPGRQPGIVPEPERPVHVVAVIAWPGAPADRVVQESVAREPDAGHGARLADDVRADGDHASQQRRLRGGELQRDGAAVAVADQQAAVDASRVEHLRQDLVGFDLHDSACPAAAGHGLDCA